MKKNFDNWNQCKQIVDRNRRRLYFREGEIWWTHFGINVGEESCGKGNKFMRPVIILKKLTGNSCIVAPTTTQSKEGSWFHKIVVHNKERWILMNQIRFMSANRFTVRESTLPDPDFHQLKKSVAKLLGLLE